MSIKIKWNCVKKMDGYLILGIYRDKWCSIFIDFYEWRFCRNKVVYFEHSIDYITNSLKRAYND